MEVENSTLSGSKEGVIRSQIPSESTASARDENLNKSAFSNDTKLSLFSKLTTSLLELKDKRQYIEADEIAKDILREAGLEKFDPVYGPNPDDLINLIEPPYVSYVAEAFFQLGLSYKNMHILTSIYSAAYCLECAQSLRPHDLKTTMNYIESVSFLEPREVANIKGFDKSTISAVIQYHHQKALALSLQCFEEHFGITSSMLDGEESFPAPFPDSQKTALVSRCLESYSRIIYKIAMRDIQCTDEQESIDDQNNLELRDGLISKMGVSALMILHFQGIPDDNDFNVVENAIRNSTGSKRVIATAYQMMAAHFRYFNDRSFAKRCAKLAKTASPKVNTFY